MNDDLTFIRYFPEKCCAEVIRKGESEPCDKVAVAVIKGHDDWDDVDSWWPVCAHHTRKDHMVPLAELLEALS